MFSQALRGQRLLRGLASFLGRWEGQNEGQMVPTWLLEACSLGRQVGSRSLPGRPPRALPEPPGPNENSVLSSVRAPEEFCNEMSPPQGGPEAALASILGTPGGPIGPPFGDLS